MIDLEQYLHTNIPLSKAMGIEVKSASSDEVILKAPLQQNINHKSTVFGGSLHSVATLSCWSLVYLHLSQIPSRYEIVVSHSEMTYLQPVHHDFEARCTFSEKEKWERFFEILKRKGRARISLEATIGDHEDPAVCFKGVFVAIDSVI